MILDFVKCLGLAFVTSFAFFAILVVMSNLKSKGFARSGLPKLEKQLLIYGSYALLVLCPIMWVVVILSGFGFNNPASASENFGMSFGGFLALIPALRWHDRCIRLRRQRMHEERSATRPERRCETSYVLDRQSS